MPSERMQRRIDAFLEEADEAATADKWALVASKARAVLSIDRDNEDAQGFLGMAVANGVSAEATSTNGPADSAGPDSPVEAPPEPISAEPESFVGGRYHVRRFLGEGGKKRVFLAHDALLDRDIAFSLIKTEGLDDIGRERIMREAQAMGRLSHPNIVAIYDIGEHAAADGSKQPFLVQELMGGGDVEGLLADTEGGLPLPQALEIAIATSRGLEFAHAQGIVHRDLKPGNVWLTADGVAKIGDLGLAVTLDQSRLTSHGMMVGTYGYMPPEQALGQAVTPQADLYSLGAMLYELVTGRPPFEGDTPTAVISQHLNTAPVAPSWHSEQCPPDLETLILGLLAKVPEDRPATATEVIAALEAVDPEGRSASHSDSSANPLDRLARGVFVGRERELEQLRGALDAALDGHGSVVMLVGEPGIGKTRTVQELETYARMRAAEMLYGRADESSGAPPYWPWIQAGRAYAAKTPEETRRREWQPYAVELQRVFTRLRDLFPDLPEAPDTDSEEAQFRLFDALASFLHSVSERTPLIVVLDDLHWADGPTLAMLTHLAREVARSRIVVVGTYRDTDLDRTHPLSRALGDLNREQLFQRILLRGLSAEEVGDYVRGTSGVAVSEQLVQRIHEETEGNPFFLSEVLNLMTEEGTLTADSVSDVAIPEGVKEALGRRLDRLSPEANELLSLAAVVGREFTHAQLVATSDHPDEEVLRLTEEALAARVVEETGDAGGYRFTHALMQETLLGELSAARRVRTHGKIAEALEELYGDAAEVNAPALARHYVESAVLNRDHAKAAARYSRLAAEQAAAAFAWDEAWRHYDRCLDLITESSDHLEEDEAPIRAAFGVVLRTVAELPLAYVEFERALELYRTRGDSNGFARVAIETIMIPTYVTPRQREAIARDSLAQQPEPELRARVIAALVFSRWDTASDALADEARGIAASRDLRDVLTRLDARDARRAMREGDLTEGWSTYRRLSALPELRGADSANLHLNAANALALRGRVDDAVSALRDGITEAAGVSPFLERACRCWLAITGISRGELDQVEHELKVLERSGRDIPSLTLARAQLAGVRGDLLEATNLLSEHLHVPGALGRLIVGLNAEYWWLLSGEADERTTDAFGGLLEAIRDIDVELGDSTTSRLIEVPDVLAAMGEEAELRQLLDRSINGTPIVGHFGTADSQDRARGLLGLRLGLPLDEVADYFQRGLEWCERERLVIPAGRCHQGLAEVAERRGDIDDAREHLDAAGELFAQYGAKLYLDQVIAKKEILKA